MKEKYRVTGMTCSACSAHVEKSVKKLNGVEKLSVNLLTETMDIMYEEALLNSNEIIAAVVKAGYGAELMQSAKYADKADGQQTQNCVNKEVGQQVQNHAKEDGTESEKIRKGVNSAKKVGDEQTAQGELAMKWRLGISIGFLLPLMYVAMYHMLQDWFGLPIPDFIMDVFHGNENAMNFALTQFLLLLPILYMNRKFFAVGFKTLAHRSPNMDSLVAVGAGAAVIYGIFAMYRISYGLGHGDMKIVSHYSHDLYFESAGTILTLITVGKYLESRSKGKTKEAINKLLQLSPKTAIVLVDGQEKEIPVQDLQKGDIFLVKPGALIPADGVVMEGCSCIEEAAITGESVPVEKKQGDKVVSATLNKAGFLQCRAERVGDDTTLAQIIRLVEEAGGSKAPIAQLADKVAGVFVPMVMGIALLTLVGWLLVGAETEFAISAAIAVLVISCPCALGLATPVAIMVGTGVGANRGILIKSGEALQLAKEIDTVVLDKTGTITEGRLKVMQVHVADASLSKDKVLQIAAALESRSEHPLAEAVMSAAGQQKITDVTDFQAIFGRGIEGNLKAMWLGEGRFYVGNLAYLSMQQIPVLSQEETVVNAMADKGWTPLLVADNGHLLGIIGVADVVKTTSIEAVKAWHDMGVQVIMLTGDHKRTAEAVRRKLEISEAVAEVLPQDKEKKIRELQRAGRKVAMIGDGINDAPALVAADVGMAIGAGTDVAIECADVILMKNDLRDAVTAMRLSRQVIRNIKENLFWAFFYNSVGIPLAAGLFYPAFGLRLSPMFGAAAMSLSSIFVVTNALRLKRFRSQFQGMHEEKEAEEKTRQTERSKEMTKVMKIEGMMCGHCTGRVQKVLEALEGVCEVEMSLEEKTAVVKMCREVPDEVLRGAVTDAGYEVKEIQSIV